MISAEYCRVMARYNSWQNNTLIATADALSDAERWAERGAFFGSIAATLNHLYWADALILQRLMGNPRPEETITHDLTSPSEWEDFKALRAARDREISAWAGDLGDADLGGNVVWFPGDGSVRVERAKALCAADLFAHQIHHRGQIHAMLTAAGAVPGPTNLSLRPGEAER